MDPEDGKVYKAEMWLEQSKLKVRGYLALFYRTQTWVRGESKGSASVVPSQSAVFIKCRKVFSNHWNSSGGVMPIVGSVIIDARTGIEFKRGHVPGAINAPGRFPNSTICRVPVTPQKTRCTDPRK
jgi:hypothetical protein